jgi:hypothetical protein
MTLHNPTTVGGKTDARSTGRKHLIGLESIPLYEYVSSDSDIGMPYGKPAVAQCADCGTAICSDCPTECCGDSFCGQCYEYHVATSGVRKPVLERTTFLRFAQGWLNSTRLFISHGPAAINLLHLCPTHRVRDCPHRRRNPLLTIVLSQFPRCKN